VARYLKSGNYANQFDSNVFMLKPSVFKDPNYKEALDLLFAGLKATLCKPKLSLEECKRMIYQGMRASLMRPVDEVKIMKYKIY
jgi:hypothetical protein